MWYSGCGVGRGVGGGGSSGVGGRGGGGGGVESHPPAPPQPPPPAAQPSTRRPHHGFCPLYSAKSQRVSVVPQSWDDQRHGSNTTLREYMPRRPRLTWNTKWNIVFFSIVCQKRQILISFLKCLTRPVRHFYWSERFSSCWGTI